MRQNILYVLDNYLSAPCVVNIMITIARILQRPRTFLSSVHLREQRDLSRQPSQFVDLCLDTGERMVTSPDRQCRLYNAAKYVGFVQGTSVSVRT